MMKIQDRALRDRSITEVVVRINFYWMTDDVEEPFSFLFFNPSYLLVGFETTKIRRQTIALMMGRLFACADDVV